VQQFVDMNKTILPFSLLLGIAVTLSAVDVAYHPKFLPGGKPGATVRQTLTDTIPIKDRTDNFINSPKRNPFDVRDPKAIDKKVEYDPASGNYLIEEKIGEDFFRPPSYMSFDEYTRYRQKQDEASYFKELSSKTRGKKDDKNPLDPFSKIDIKKDLINRLFGGNTIEIKPQGNVDLTFGYNYQRLENPILNLRQRSQFLFNFDMNIQMNVQGKIGEKLNLNTNYNTAATFDFDQVIKLNYDSQKFGEDDILKKIEAGNVSMPLRGTLIQGAQSLFGLKTELQFGHLRLTTLVAQQKSERKNIQIQGGSQLQEFDVKADEYDENRHFLLSHYNREAFEPALQNLPQIRSLFKIENIEVWITNDRNEVDNVRDIVALADLGEGREDWLVNTNSVDLRLGAPKDITGIPLPDNRANNLYDRIIGQGDARAIEKSISTLRSQFGMVPTRDFEKVTARKLKPSEYTVHPELGFVSLRINVLPDQTVGVAYQYTYNGRSYKVGELSNNSENIRPDSSLNVLYVKLLKSTIQRTDIATWDLMMKNVYPTGATQVDQKEFRLDIYYEDPGKGVKRFLPETNLQGVPLLRVFNVDVLNIQGDPQPDGIFDFVPDLTINPGTGRVMFPVLEPFGSSLLKKIKDTPADITKKYIYQELYDSTLFRAQEFQEKNRYVIKGTYKSSVSSEISLGAFNIPQGSVKVSGGGQQLVEGRDYEIDYNLGRLRILNDAILASGAQINVSLEDNTLFGFQNRSMFGIRADYEFDKNFNVGATLMKLWERPFTQKVNIGEDPINNNVYGFDVNFKREAPWLTKLIDGIPGLSTKAPSSISFTGELAAIKPGHAKAINQNRKDDGGAVYVDDFEGANSTFDLRQPIINWYLASAPQDQSGNNPAARPEALFRDDLTYGYNRAKMSWYRIDNFGIRTGQQDNVNPYTRVIPQNEVFPNRQLQLTELPNIQTLDIVYNPRERGPYNFEQPNGSPYSKGLEFVGGQTLLKAPKTRWAGIMRAMTINDFQATNIEFLEFWMLSPFLNTDGSKAAAPDADKKQGYLTFQLGNISEDILKDGLRFFENGLPSNFNKDRRTRETSWSKVPLTQQVTAAFDNDTTSRRLQDVGLDGLTDAGERAKFAPWLNSIRSVNVNAASRLEQDPSGDNFRFWNDSSFPANVDVVTRYRDFNNPEGNSATNTSRQSQSSSTNNPDAEDLNFDNTLNETEAYFQYRIPIFHDKNGEINLDSARLRQGGVKLVTDRIEKDGRIWYRFRMPLSQFDRAVGGIRDFRSIRFMRILLDGFESQVNFRFATMEFVRNQWRKYTQDLSPDVNSPCSIDAGTVFEVDAVNIEENTDPSQARPFGYVLPLGIQREQSIGGVINTLQNEQSLSLSLQNLCDGDERAVFKNIGLDMRVYKRFKMFVHAEDYDQTLTPRDSSGLRVFVRLGSDFKNNYYEYEMPLVFSRKDKLPNTNTPSVSPPYKQEVWKVENEFDFPLELLRQVKEERNAISGSANLEQEYVKQITIKLESGEEVKRWVKVRGNPNLGNAKIAMIGIRNPEGGEVNPVGAVVWANEMRLTGLDERGGVAGLGRLDVQMADLGNVTVAGNFGTIGYGAIDQKVQQRSRFDNSGFDLAGNLELNKFLPKNLNIHLPLYAQYSRTVETPEYDPYDLDVILKEKIRKTDNATVRDSIKRTTQEINTVKSYNLTNVRKDRSPENQGKPMPWDISNFAASYGYTATDRSDPFIESDQVEKYNGGINYQYSAQEKYLQPFKGIKGSALKLISEINFNPLPSSITVSSLMDRQFQTTKYRFTDLDPKYSTFYNKRFLWTRNYNLQWGLTKGLKFNFNAVNNGVVDEPNESELRERGLTLSEVNRYRRDSIWSNVKNLGRTKNYRHEFTLNYTLPTKLIPYMEWVGVKGQYRGDYGWTAAALNTDSLGNVIQNGQNIQANADLNFDQLYSKIPFLRKIDQGTRSGGGEPGSTRKSRTQTDPAAAGEKDKEKKGGGDLSPTVKLILRPLLSLRKARFNYSEQHSTVIPGYTPTSRLLGMNQFNSPGWDFVGGFQPRISKLREDEYGSATDWLAQAANKGWMSASVFQNREVTQLSTQTWDARVTIEPFRDMRLDLDISRSYTQNHSQYFKDTILDGSTRFVHAIPQDVGTLTMSYSALKTLFKGDTADLRTLFKTFENNRITISQRLGVGEHVDTTLAKQGYTYGYGRTQQEVLIPAFLAAYTGQDPRGINLSLFELLPKVNWRFTYNGLSRLPFFKEYFQSFSLTHGYKSSLTVNTFNTGLDFVRTRDQGFLNELNNNFYPRLEVPEIVIQEGFNPLIAVSAVMKNGMSFNFDYKLTRNLAMSFVSNQLAETRKKEIVFGFGHKINDFDINSIFGKTKKKKRPAPKANPNKTGPGGSTTIAPRALDLQFNFSLSDDVTFNHLLDQGVREPTRGSYQLSMSPSAEYKLNQRLSLRFFVDYRRSEPKTSAGYPRTDSSGGVVVRFALQ
jgi:cell surface protein SprA